MNSLDMYLHICNEGRKDKKEDLLICIRKELSVSPYTIQNSSFLNALKEETEEMVSAEWDYPKRIGLVDGWQILNEVCIENWEGGLDERFLFNRSIFPGSQLEKANEVLCLFEQLEASLAEKQKAEVQKLKINNVVNIYDQLQDAIMPQFTNWMYEYQSLSDAIVENQKLVQAILMVRQFNVLDACYRIQNMISKDENLEKKNHSLLEKMIRNMTEQNVEVIHSNENDVYDETKHEALNSLTNVENVTILESVRPGFQYHGSVIQKEQIIVQGKSDE